MSAPINQMPKSKYVPHKTLEESELFVSVGNSPYILAIKTVVTKVCRIEGPDGKPGLDQNGQPMYFYQTQCTTAILTAEEYNVRKKMEDLR